VTLSFFRFKLAPDDLLHDRAFRRLWTSILISSLGAQVSMLAVPLTAVVLLQASATQMGFMTALAVAPYIFFSLPAGVWLDRVRKLPVYVGGEVLCALALASVPLAWWLGALSMGWLYVVEFIIGLVHTVAGTASQVVLTQVVPRERLVQAHAKNALATSGSEVAGPALAGLLIKVLGAPLALLLDAALLLASALILRGVQVREHVVVDRSHRFWAELKVGLHFVATQRVLVVLAMVMAVWQTCHYAAIVVQILFATRTLGLSEQQVGLCYIGVGVGTIAAGVLGHRISAHIGPGPCLTLGFGVCAVAWLVLAAAPTGAWGVAAFAFMLVTFSVGATLVFINFLALRQSVTPHHLLGRMTSVMRWLTLLAAGPGALLGGWLGEHISYRATLVFAGSTCLVLTLVAWRLPTLRNLKVLPQPQA
jgi:MFS family permease